jgi:competence ComEA-like helix-hairpin-helix protein
MDTLTVRVTCRLAVLAVSLALIAFGCGSEPSPQLNLRTPVSVSAIDINTADKEILEALPGIGVRTAEKIIEFRRTYGPFRRVEQLMLVDGISEKKFRSLRGSVKVSGIDRSGEN